MRSSTARIFDSIPTSDNSATSINSEESTQQNLFIVQETENNKSDIKNWRTLQMAMGDELYEQHHLWLSISGALNKLAWQKIAENIDETTNHKVKRKIVLDMRQETHLYLNDEGIALATSYETNIGMNCNQVLEEENNLLQTLSQRSPVYISPSGELKENNLESGTYVPRQTIQNEEEMVKEQGFDAYYRFAVTDHRAPSNEDIDRFVELFDELEKEKEEDDDVWLHVHCKGGRGRSSTIAAFYIMLKMANQISCEDIVSKLASVPPNYNLFNTETSHLEQRKIRNAVVDNFYLFAQARLNGYAKTWSNWVVENAEIVSANIAKHAEADVEQQNRQHEPISYRKYT